MDTKVGLLNVRANTIKFNVKNSRSTRFLALFLTADIRRKAVLSVNTKESYLMGLLHVY